MKKILFSMACACSLAASGAEVHADMSHNLWWNAPEVPVLRLILTDSVASRGTVAVDVAPDIPGRCGSVKAQFDYVLARPGASDTLELALPSLQPGFYRCTVSGDVTDSFNIGYEPTNIVSLPDAPDDFDEFWAKAKEELATVPGDFKLTELTAKSGKKRKMYLAEMTSLGGERVKMQVAIPVADGKYPVQIYYNGYGAKPWELAVDANPNVIEIMASARGQFFSEADNTYGDWIRYNLDKPAEYYYRGAFMDCIRAIDFACSLPQADTDRIFVEGGSQGGAFTIVAAALDDRVRAAAPYIPFLNDYRDYFSIVDWPAQPVREQAAKLGMSEEQMFANVRYVDVKNLARRIKCPVLMGIGLQDPVCPPHTNMASYNLIESPKELVIYPQCGHWVDYGDWNPRRDAFFAKWGAKK